VVKRPPDQPKAPLVVLSSTNTWRAYNSFPFGNSSDEPGIPSYSLYRKHIGGQGSYYLGTKMPLPAASPYEVYGSTSTYSHLVRAERFLHVWLEKSGYDFDLITDFDLHNAPDILNGYKCLIINGHSEYWSIPAYENIQHFLGQGGDVVSLSGNTMFWRVSFDQDGSVMECRKVDTPDQHVPLSQPREAWHSQDGQRGGLMRNVGYPAWKLLGLETLGWHNAHFEQFSSYHVWEAEHFLFKKPKEITIRRGDLFAKADKEVPAAHGHEVDARLSTVLKIQREPPPMGVKVPITEDANAIVLLAKGTFQREDLGVTLIDYYGRQVAYSDSVGGEMIYWEREKGGRVFNAGTIGLGGALMRDDVFGTLLSNVLFHFDVKPDR